MGCHQEIQYLRPDGQAHHRLTRTRLTCPVVDIEDFYDEDPRRRSSAELEFGRDWHDAHGVRYELSWVEDTGELYVMREPVPEGWATPFGGIHVVHARGTDVREIAGMTVTVLGVRSSQSQVDQALAGWDAAMGDPDSVGWLAGRLRQAGLLATGESGGQHAAPETTGPAAP